MRLPAAVPAILAIAGALPLAAADLRLPAVFSDHAVLQRDRGIPVWGWADAGTTVTVAFDGSSATATAAADGRWMARLPAHPAGGPFRMEIATAAGAKKAVEDLLVGEVWICSGQSNMQWTVGQSNDPEKEVAAARLPGIRLLGVPRVVKEEPQDDVQAAWRVCDPANVASFSGVGFFFGRELHARLQMPIGLIDSSWGGTPAEAWTEQSRIVGDADFKPMWERWLASKEPQSKAIYEKKVEEYKARAEFEDPGLSATAAGWSSPALDESGWRELPQPGAIEEAGAEWTINGGIWYRRSVEVPAAWAGKDLQLDLGAIDDFDIAWFDGVEVGRTGKDAANWWQVPRSYRVPAAAVKGGKAVIAVRVWDRYLTGGMVGLASAMRLFPVGDEKAAIPLAGAWKVKVEVSRPQPKEQPPQPTSRPEHAPGLLYHSMIRPLVPYGIRGAIWYQGESNAGRAEQYRKLLPAMVGTWRDAWGQGDLGFYIVSLANWQAGSAEPRPSEWGELREAQDLAARTLRHAGQAMAIDIGDPKDIHPRNKQEVGRRLALQALKRTYGQDVVASGPTLREVAIDGASVRVRFADLGGGLATSDQKALRGFALAGADRKFVWATSARIDGDAVVLAADGLANPVAVRYAWDINPDCNLVNKEGLPAVPFRSDDWPMATAGRR